MKTQNTQTTISEGLENFVKLLSSKDGLEKIIAHDVDILSDLVDLIRRMKKVSEVENIPTRRIR